MNESNIRVKALSIFSLALLSLVLAACQMTPRAETLPQGLPDGFDLTTAKVREPLRDEFGRYRTASSRAAIGDDGVLIRVEERFYIDSSQVRFVVLQKNLALRLAGPGISAMGLRLYQRGSTLATMDLTQAAHAESATQELYTTQFFQSNMSWETVGDRTCAVLDVDFTDETWYPLSLDTCDQRSLSLLSVN